MVAHGAQPTLVRICDPEGRRRGTGFLADDLGTLITSHEAVDGLSRVLVQAPSGRSCTVEAGAVTPLPERDLALVPTTGLDVPPLVIGAQRAMPAGDPVRLRIGQWLDAEIAGTAEATYTYTSTHRFHPLAEVLELALPEEACLRLRLSKEESGTPVLDRDTGAVLAVLGAALHSPGRAAAFAVPLRGGGTPEPDGPPEGALGALLARNGTTVPGFGPDLNLAGALQLTATSAGPAVERAGRPVERPEVEDAFREFGASAAVVAALVGKPGTGRSTELAALASRRARGAAPEPTVWLRGADLAADDNGVREAVGRALAAAGRIVTASRTAAGGGAPEGADADVVARLARDAGRPLLVLLDGPEEMPVGLASDLRRWTAGTVSWLRASGARMVIACGPEYWEQAGPHFPPELLFASESDARRRPGLPPCVPLGYLSSRQAARARARYGLPDGALAERDAGHPLLIRMLAEIHAAMGPDGRAGVCAPGPGQVSPGRSEIFSAHLDLISLRIAVRLAAGQRGGSRGGAVRGNALRRLAAGVSRRLHEAARRCLGPGQGGLSGEAFETVFPWGSGWASAVLAEEVLVPAGEVYRFADEEFADWLQGSHLELDGALDALLYRAGAAVPRHRLGPVTEALLLCEQEHGTEALARRLEPLVHASADGTGQASEAAWWAGHLLAEALPRVPDARPYTGLLAVLAGHVADGRTQGFGPAFWRSLQLPVEERVALLRLLLPADPPHGPSSGERFLDAVGELLADAPRTVQPLLCEWFDDRRELRRRADVPSDRPPDVATAAQALLYTHRRHATDELVDALRQSGHPHAQELLADLVHDETSAVCRAAVRWARDADPALRAAAARYGLAAAAVPVGESDRELLRHAARALLRRPDAPVPGAALHGQALAVLLHDPSVRRQYFDEAAEHFASKGAPELGAAFVSVLTACPDEVLAVFRELLHRSAAGAHAVLCALVRVREPALAQKTAQLVDEYAELRPESAAQAVAAFVRDSLGTAPGGVLGPQIKVLLRVRHAPFRAALARALGETEALRGEPVDVLLAGEDDPAVLLALLDAVVRRGEQHGEVLDGEAVELVRRIGPAMSRTPEGTAEFDGRLVDLAREIPGFAGLIRTWFAGSPGQRPVTGPPDEGRTGDADGRAVFSR